MQRRQSYSIFKKQAKSISSKLRLCSLKRHVYTQKDGFLATINKETKCCPCLFFNDKAICKHLVAACINDDVELYGLKAKSNQFKTLRRRIVRPVDDSILVEPELEIAVFGLFSFI
jgi:hypothetical protein